MYGRLEDFHPTEHRTKVNFLKYKVAWLKVNLLGERSSNSAQKPDLHDGVCTIPIEIYWVD